MKLLRPEPHQANAGLRAMVSIASADGPMGPAARALLTAIQKHLLATNFDLDALPRISPDELDRIVPQGPLREQLVHGMPLVSAADGPPSRAATDLVGAYAEALGVTLVDVELIQRLHEYQFAIFKLDFLRRSHVADIVGNQLKRDGLFGTAKAFAAFRGLTEDKARAAKYRALEALPEGTLGHAFCAYIRENGFSMPGEKHGFPEAGIYHDFAHVLSGYPTTSEGEIQVAAFIAGFKRENPFMVILFAMLTFGAGLNVTPIDQPHSTSILAQKGLADRFAEALMRGAAMTVDLSANEFDPFAYVHRPLDEVRREMGVPPMA